jgi:hypothetical protein
MHNTATIKPSVNIRLLAIFGLIATISFYIIFRFGHTSPPKLTSEIFAVQTIEEIEVLIAAQTTDELLKSKKSLEILIDEHTQKLADYQLDPDKFDNKNKLKEIAKDLRDKIIKGRIAKLEKEIEKFKKLIEQINHKLLQNGN